MGEWPVTATTFGQVFPFHPKIKKPEQSINSFCSRPLFLRSLLSAIGPLETSIPGPIGTEKQTVHKLNNNHGISAIGPNSGTCWASSVHRPPRCLSLTPHSLSAYFFPKNPASISVLSSSVNLQLKNLYFVCNNGEL